MAYHSLTFINGGAKRNTWDDWHLIPTSRPVIEMPGIVTNYVDIPGASGSLDLTEALSGYPVYKDREGSIEFMIMHTLLDSSAGENLGYRALTTGAWALLVNNIASFLHGKKLRMLYEDEPGECYEGRFAVSDVKSGDSCMTFSIEYHLAPFKYEVDPETGADKYSSSLWLWDPLHFTSGTNKYTGEVDDSKGTHIKTYTDYSYSSGTSITFYNPSSAPVSARVYVSVESTVVTQNGSVDLSVGSNTNGLLMLYPGNNTWVFSTNDGSTAGLSVDFQRRSL